MEAKCDVDKKLPRSYEGCSGVTTGAVFSSESCEYEEDALEGGGVVGPHRGSSDLPGGPKMSSKVSGSINFENDRQQ